MNSRDRESSFAGTYVRAEVEGRWRAVYVERVAGERLGVRVGSNKDYMELGADCFDLTQPDLGMMWWRGNLYYISRRPARQWRRGLRPKGLTVYKLMADGLVTRQEANSELLQAIAFQFLEGNRPHECVLSPNFGRRGKLLYFRSVPVGTISGTDITLEYDIDIRIEGYNVCQK